MDPIACGFLGAGSCYGAFSDCGGQCAKGCFDVIDCPEVPGFTVDCLMADFDSQCWITCSMTDDCPGGMACTNDGKCWWPARSG
jgi:hypothetical protein